MSQCFVGVIRSRVSFYWNLAITIVERFNRRIFNGNEIAVRD